MLSGRRRSPPSTGSSSPRTPASCPASSRSSSRRVGAWSCPPPREWSWWSGTAMTSRSGGPWAATASCPCGWCAAPVMPSPSDRPLRLIARGPVPGRRRGRAARQPRNPDGPSSTGMPHNVLMEARTPRITVVGSLNQDITVTVSRFPEPGETLIGTSVSYRLGGKGANQAVAAARAGAEVWFVGRVGGDAAGLTLRQSLRDFGVRDELLAVDRGVPTGTAHITVDANGDNEIIVVPGANGVVDLSGLREGHPARDADVFVTQGEVPPATVAAAPRPGSRRRPRRGPDAPLAARTGRRRRSPPGRR